MTSMRCDRLTTTNLQLAKGPKKEPRQNQKKKKKTVSLPTSTQTNTKGHEIWRYGGMTTTSLCPPPSKNEEDTKKMRKKKVEKVEMKTSTTVKKKEREKRKKKTKNKTSRCARSSGWKEKMQSGRSERERDRARAGEQCAARKKSAENWAEFATTKFYCSYSVVVLWS